MARCRICNEPQSTDSTGRRYCPGVCKATVKKVRENIRRDNMVFRKELKLGCTRCKKKLTEDEGIYCDKCVAYMEAEKKKRKETDTFRPCKNRECTNIMKNPAPNRKWCDECREVKNKEAYVRQELRRSAKRKAITAAKKALKPVVIRKDGTDPFDRHKGTINKKFLVRGLVSDTNVHSRMEA